RIIAKAIGIAAKRPDFRFFLESDNFVDNYMASHQGAPELEQFRKLVKEGRIEIAPNWADIFLNQPEGEVIVRNLLYGTRYARSIFGVNPPVFHPGDIPGFPSQLPQILAGFHIPFMVMTRIGPADRSLFNWESPDGSKSLVWNAIHGYGWGIHLNLHNEFTETTLNT